VVAIIAIIAAISVPSLSSFKSNSEVSLLAMPRDARKARETMYSDGERIQSHVGAVTLSSVNDRSRELSQPPMGSEVQSLGPLNPTTIVLPASGERHTSELALNDSKVSFGAFPSGAAQDAFVPAPAAAAIPPGNPVFDAGSTGGLHVEVAQKDSLFYRL